MPAIPGICRAACTRRSSTVCVGDPLVAEIPVDAHFGAQIVGADQQNIDPRHRGDLGRVLDRGRGFEHDHRQVRGVERRRRLAARRRAQPVMRPDPAHRAVPDRRVFEPVDDLARLGGVIDMRHHDAEHAVVERPRRDRVFAVGHPRDRGDAGVERRRRDLRAGLRAT